MSRYFPTDVSLRIEGDDLPAAQKLFPRAANLLYKALALQNEGKEFVRLFQPGDDGSFVSVFIARGQKHVYVHPGPRSGEVVTPEKPVEQPTPLKTYLNDMWSGIARGTPTNVVPVVTSIPNPDGDDPLTVPALNTFHPDAVTAAAYQLDFNWQTPPRLGVSDSGGSSGVATSSYPKPSMYSGSMKRLVSCVLGLGRTETETAEYISGDLPASYPNLIAYNQYDFTWLRTHGLYKAADGSVWIIEISKLNGVLAMPLPLFDGTNEPGYEYWLAAVGDTDTMAMVLEFGGLPTGEKFPTGTTLADAIASGKVVRLASVADLAPFYHDAAFDKDKNGYFPNCGWAFSESGTRAINTCHWYSNPEIVGPPPLPTGYPYAVWVTNDDPAYDYFVQVLIADGYQFAPARQRFLRGEYWRVTISLLANPLFGQEGQPIGVGNAVLELVEEGYFFHGRDHSRFGFISAGAPNEDGFAYQWRAPPWRFPAIGAAELVSDSTPAFGRPTYNSTADNADRDGSTPAMFVFFNNETPEIVRYHARDTVNTALFRGTTVDFGFTQLDGYTGGGFDVGLLVPAYCREGYALMKFTGQGSHAAPGETNGSIQTRGFFVGAGVLDFSDTVVPLSPEPAYGGLSWLIRFASNYFGGYVLSPKFAASINSGPLVGYVINDGVETVIPASGPGPKGYVQSPRLAPFAIPTNTPAQSITFVGSCSDG